MGKKIKNPIELRVLASFDPSDVETPKVCYEVTCEHSLSETKMLLLQHTPELRDAVKNFAEEAVKQLDVHEEIAEEDSLLSL